jgi:hypothetical protein
LHGREIEKKNDSFLSAVGAAAFFERMQLQNWHNYALHLVGFVPLKTNASQGCQKVHMFVYQKSELW